ncbi:MAG: hypothetical protein MZV63_07350 [Marinilabiliales bacterium]|nr:hypothetical protein [Marinilabiliales bacterium]
MARLVHQRSTAVEFPRPVPRVRVVLFRAPPGYVHAGIGDCTEPSRADRLAKGILRVGKSILEYSAQLRTGFLVGFYHGIHPFESHLQRFSADRVLSPRRGKYRLHVGAAGRCHGQDVDVGAMRHLLQGAENPASVLLRELFRTLGHRVVASTQRSALEFPDRRSVKVRDQTGANNPEPVFPHDVPLFTLDARVGAKHPCHRDRPLESSGPVSLRTARPPVDAAPG